MGVCSSCLSRRRKPSTDDADSRLLFDDPHSVNYGSFGDQHPSTLHADPQDVQRESEALQRIVAQTSSHLVDIFAMVPQNVQRSPSTFSGKDTRLSQYQTVLANLPSSNQTVPSSDTSTDNTLQDAMEWPSDDEDVEVMNGFKVNKPEKSGPLLGGFTDIGASIG